MIRTYCLDNEKDWDEGISLLLFAVRESVQKSLGFSPFELVFGHSVHGPLKLLKENWLSENTESLNLLDYSVDSRNFKKWGRSPTTTQNVGEGLKILGDDFMMKFKLIKNTFSVYLDIFNWASIN